MSIFKACDIRGVVGSELDEPTIRRIGRSLAAMIRRRSAGPICIAGDFRRSTPTLKDALLHGILEGGVKVYDVGQCPTPVAYFAARRLNAPNVAIVTASHNGGEYNGVKFMVAWQPAVPELLRELRDGLDTASLAKTPGQAEPADLLPAYENQIQADAIATAGASPADVKRHGVRVVLDTMAGAFTRIAPRILAAVGCQVTSLVSDVDPDFAKRRPNPAVKANLRHLRRIVPAERADLGIALDGDGDRAAIIDHAGHVVHPEQIGALLAGQCFSRPTVIYDQKCASVLAKAVNHAGGACLMRPSGYGFIRTAMIERRADLGVEVSGHYFFDALGGGDDGLFAALLIVFLLARSTHSLAEMVAPIGWPAITHDLRIPFEGDATATLDRIASACGGEILRIDGVRAQYEDGWGLARMSITEPLITLRFEGRDRRSMADVANRFLRGAPELYAQIKEKLDE